MEKKNKRILWLLNHTTLRSSEVDMLVDLGFEVFTPKILPDDRNFRSGSISYKYDHTLSIPSRLLEKMNQFNFYQQSWNRSFKNQINSHFGSAIVSKTSVPLINFVSEAFHGKIFLRAFGYSETSGASYEELATSRWSKITYNRLTKKKDFYLGYGYENVLDLEPKWIRERGVFLPLAVPPNIYLNQGKYLGDEEKILFVCPDINYTLYYQKIYTEFKNNFSRFPYVIAGAQRRPVLEDPNVVNFLKREEYDQLYVHSKVMFYHSREEKHIHYHPFEAIIFGMPLVFFSGGMLEYMAGKKLPGCVDTWAEAKDIIGRILSDDQRLISEIIESQKVLLDSMDPNNVKEVWRRNFIPILEDKAIEDDSKKISEKKYYKNAVNIGVWLHEANPKGLSGEGILHLLGMVSKGLIDRRDIRLSIACVSWMPGPLTQFLAKYGIHEEDIEYITINKEAPFVFRLHLWWIQRKPKPRRKLKFFETVRQAFKYLSIQVLQEIVQIRSWWSIFLWVVIGLLSLPILALAGIVYLLLFSGSKAIESWEKSGLHRKLVNKIDALVDRGLAVGRVLYTKMIDLEFQNLSKAANKNKQIDGWFIPYPRNVHIADLEKPVIVAVPDLVYLDFPSNFAKEFPELNNAHGEIVDTIHKASSIITYSEYVKDNHLLNHRLKTAEHIDVIPHAPIDIRGQITNWDWVEIKDLKYKAAINIKNYLEKNQVGSDSEWEYLQSLPFGEFDYLFVSSQTRPHKNHLNTLKAFRNLLRESYRNTKLIFTGQISPEMQSFIDEEKLHFDVLSIPKIPPREHASFFACARLVIVPTLFEGGFPFVFSEALSVGTPVLISNIPVVKEVLPEELQEIACFDPYDIQDMTQRMEWALDNSDRLFTEEQKVLNDQCQRTWDDVAKEYAAVFKNTSRSKSVYLTTKNKNKQFCFIHIPKTAGTSFSHVANSIVPHDKKLTIHWDDLFDQSEQDFSNISLLHGHFPYEINKLLDKPPTYLTFLRDPINRAISQYLQSKRFPQHWAYDRLQEISIETYLDDPYLSGEIANVQTWAFGLQVDSPVKSINDLMNPREYPESVLKEMARNPYEPVWRMGLHLGTPSLAYSNNRKTISIADDRAVSLEVATERLKKTEFIGLTERFIDSLYLLAFTFNMPPIKHIPRIKIAEKRLSQEDLHPETLKKFQELNAMDIELYKVGVKLFENRFNNMVEKLQNRFPNEGDKDIQELLELNYLNYG
jgi:glycosyltransferase involved in cell wall biosynthesis